MGNVQNLCSQDHSTSTIKVCTLNYCGISDNPFQFYCEDKERKQELKKIGYIFKRLIQIYQNKPITKQNFKWTCSKLDKQKRNRYSPFFNKEAGIHTIKNAMIDQDLKTQNDRFMTRKQFQQKWQEQYCSNYKKRKDQLLKQQKQLQLYDYLMYYALMRYVFPSQIHEDDKLQIKIQRNNQQAVDKYRKQISQFFQLQYINKQTKSQKLKQILNKRYDILFIQEMQTQLYRKIYQQKRFIGSQSKIQDEKCLMPPIILTSQQFNQKNQTKIQTFRRFNEIINNIAKLDEKATPIKCQLVGKYVLICAHLSSTKQKNTSQVQNLKNGLTQLYKKIQQNQLQLQIILGGDLNSFVQPFDNFHMFPTKQHQWTTVKMRTYTQAQLKKADQLIRQSKDKIISTMQIVSSNILQVSKNIKQLDNGEKYNLLQKASVKSFIPTAQHPFDHFVVQAILKIK